MNELQQLFLDKRPYLIKAISKITKEDVQFMKSINANSVNKENVRKLQEIAKKMTKGMNKNELARFGKDLIELIKLGNQQKTTDGASLQETLEVEKPSDSELNYTD